MFIKFSCFIVTFYIWERKNTFVMNFRTITALVFSLLMLSTSLGAVVYQHFCGSSLKEVSLTKIEKHCKAHQTEGMCHHETEKEGCCKTEKQNLDTSDKNKPSSENYGIIKKGSQFVTVFYVLVQYLFTNPFESSGNAIVEVSPDPPPLPTDSLHVSYQQFLI
jgi:hypothetical protein